MKHHLLPILLLFAACGSATADVVEATPNSFVVETSVLVPGTPDAAFVGFTQSIGAWWDSAHTWSGDANNLGLEAKAGKCFCEQLPNGGSVEHGRVIFVQPGKLLRLDAALGPFQDMAVKGVLTFRFKADGDKTRVTVNYRVAGTFTMESDKLAPGADGMLSGQMQRFKLFMETGKPTK